MFAGMWKKFIKMLHDGILIMDGTSIQFMNQTVYDYFGIGSESSSGFQESEQPVFSTVSENDALTAALEKLRLKDNPRTNLYEYLKEQESQGVVPRNRREAQQEGVVFKYR